MALGDSVCCRDAADDADQLDLALQRYGLAGGDHFELADELALQRRVAA